MQVVEQHDGSMLVLRKLDADYDSSDRVAAMSYLQTPRRQGRDRHRPALSSTASPSDLHGSLNTVATPLNELRRRELCPGSAALEKINASLR